MHGSDKNFLVLFFLLTIEKEWIQEEKALTLWVRKLCFSCRVSDATCLYKSAETKSLLLMGVTSRCMSGTRGKNHEDISGSIENSFLIYPAR